PGGARGLRGPFRRALRSARLHAHGPSPVTRGDRFGACAPSDVGRSASRRSTASHGILAATASARDASGPATKTAMNYFLLLLLSSRPGRAWSCVSAVRRGRLKDVDLFGRDDFDLAGGDEFLAGRAPGKKMRRVHVRIERRARSPALDDHQLVRVVDAQVHVVKNAALFLHRAGDGLARRGDGLLRGAGFQFQFSDDVDHGRFPSRFSFQKRRSTATPDIRHFFIPEFINSRFMPLARDGVRSRLCDRSLMLGSGRTRMAAMAGKRRRRGCCLQHLWLSRFRSWLSVTGYNAAGFGWRVEMDPRACDGQTTVCPLWLLGAPFGFPRRGRRGARRNYQSSSKPSFRGTRFCCAA